MNNKSNDNMFNINKFRNKKKNYYNDEQECLKESYKTTKKRVQTNPKFKTFDQIYYTAGDEDDFDKYGYLPTRYYYSMKEKIDKTIVNKTVVDKNYFTLYKNIDYTSIKNTFDYLFYKFKKGIYVIIHDNKLLLYLPFSNANYKNDWVKQTYFNEMEKKLLETKDYKHIQKELNQTIIDFQKKYPEQFQYGRKIDFHRERWYANNCVFRNLYPTYEGELNIDVFKNMLETLVKERKIPNVEFFMNDRDFPLLKKDLTEPYQHLYDSEKVKIDKKFQHKKYAPLFSKSITDEYADILLPTNDDWVKASNHYFLDECSNKLHNKEWEKININWETKIPICIFRGSATGCGITVENNMRLKAAKLSVENKDILDAGITDWNARPKKFMKRPIEIIDISSFDFKIANKITNIEKSNYKYILNIDGNVSAFRLSSELSMMSVVFIVKSPYKLWYSHLLKEYEHFIPIKEDLSDLIEQIKWCIKNDKKCYQIAKNAHTFYNRYLTKDAILDYMKTKLETIHSNRNHKNLLDIKKTKKRIAIITCYRNNDSGSRSKERFLFIKLMNQLLEPYCDFHIYIVEQSVDGEKFNIGKLKNIGFEIANKNNKYDNFIFSDIDTIPNYDLIQYFFQKLDNPISLAIRGTRYENVNTKTNKIFVGALLGFNKKIFQKINGYPNNMYGWGGEDDALLTRLTLNHFTKIYYPKIGNIIDFEENNGKTIDLQNKLKIIDKETIKYEKLYEDLTSWDKNGLNTLHYKVINTEKINDNTTQIKVDLLKKMEEKNFSNLYNIQLQNYNKMKNTLKNKIKEERMKLTIVYI
jgi:hypothetical protein